MRIARHGRLRHSGYDFAAERRRLLDEIPGIEIAQRNRWHNRSPTIRALVAQAAFIKSSLHLRGRHLSSGGKLLYVRIPKAASTALCGAVLRRRFPFLEAGPEHINALADTCLETTTPPDGQEVFTVVRNPFARIVSVYRAFFENNGGYFLYQDYLFGIIQRAFTFREFVETVSIIPDALKDQHFRPQNRLLAFYDKHKVDVHIIRLEDTGVLNEYLDTHGLAMATGDAPRPSYNYSAYYDPQVLETVRAIYEDDLARFKYHEVYDHLRYTTEQRAVQNRTKSGGR